MKKLIFTLLFLLLFAQSSFALNQNLYVTESGAGTQDGKSLTNAWSVTNLNTAGNWDTVDNANKIDPGDIVYVDGTITSAITIAGSGDSSNRIYFNLMTAVFSGGTRAILSTNKNYLTFLNGEFTGTYSQAQIIQIYEGKHIILDGLYIHDVAKIGIQIYGADGRASEDILINNFRCINETDYCIQTVVGSGSGGGEENTIHDFAIQNSYANNVKTFYQSYGSQTNMYGGLTNDDTTNIAPYNILITNNIIDGTTAAAIITSGCRELGNKTIISHNQLLNIGSASVAAVNAVQLGNCDGVVVEYNEIYNTQTNVTDGCAVILDWGYTALGFITENAIVRYNYIYGNTTQSDGKGISFYYATGCSAYGNILDDNTIGIKCSKAQSTSNLAYNNTINNNTANSEHAIFVTDNCGGLTLQNNIINGVPTIAHVEVDTGSTLTADNNDYYPNTGTLFRYGDVAKNFADWQTALGGCPNAGNDCSSLTSDPQFVNPSGGDFRILGNSPAIDKGVDVATGAELTINGNMELNSDWDSINSPETNEQSNVQKHGGTYSRHISDSTASYGGIQQTGKSMITGDKYIIDFYYYLISGTLGAGMLNGEQCWAVGSPIIFTTVGSWQHASVITDNQTTGAFGGLRFFNDSDSVACEFYIDDVSFRKVESKIDYRGTKVPRGTAPDMGALEYWLKTSLPMAKFSFNPVDIRVLYLEKSVE